MFPIDKQPAIVPAEQNEATISGHSMHDARREERSPDNLTMKPPDVAIEPVKNSAVVSPDQNTAVPANDGGYVVQVSAERSDARHKHRSRLSSPDTPTSSAAVRH